LYRLRRCPNRYGAAGRVAAGYFLLLAQEKVTKEKGNPEPPIPVPCMDAQMPRSAWMRESGRFSPKAGLARRHIPVPLASSRSRREPRYARLFPPSAAMLGGGYGSQRQQQHRLPKSGI
jgi:hypothetical protein